MVALQCRLQGLGDKLTMTQEGLLTDHVKTLVYIGSFAAWLISVLDSGACSAVHD